MVKVNEKNNKIKKKVNPKGAKSVLIDPDVKNTWNIDDFLLTPLVKELITLLSFLKSSPV